jgi:hypothetical protein
MWTKVTILLLSVALLFMFHGYILQAAVLIGYVIFGNFVGEDN